MIKVFYIEDENGSYISDDGAKRWTRLAGKELYDYLQTDKGKHTYFYTDTDEDGNCVGVEISDDELRANIIKTDKHSTYLKQMKAKYGCETVSIDAYEQEDGESKGYEVADETVDFLEAFAYKEDLAILQDALSMLTPEEMLIVKKLYLYPVRLTTRELAKEMGVTKTVIVRRTDRIFQKLKKYF